MSAEKKNPFNEATVVQSRQSFADTAGESEFNLADDESHDEVPATPPPPPVSRSESVSPQSQEKTVVFAKSNLKETFDARTVVMTKPAREASVTPPSLPTAAPVSVSPAPAPSAAAAPPAAPAAAAPAAAAAAEEKPKVLAVELPAPSLEKTDPGVKVQTGSFAMKVEKDEPAPKKLSNEARREARKQLDRRTKTMVAAFATVCALVVLCLLVAFGGPKAETSKTADQPATSHASTELASTNEAPAPVAKKTFTDYQNTTDVLSKFDRAAQKAQQHAF